MASYTMQLREYIEQVTQYQEDLSTKEKIEEGRAKLFDFDYPIFDENYKKVFETNFIRKFYMREIGFETEGLFKFQLETWLLIHMPYFNKMFESELLEYDPLTNSKMSVTHSKTSDKSQTATSTGSSSSVNDQENNSTVEKDGFNRQLDSNNPDTRLNITTENGEGVIEYASSISEDSEKNKQTANASSTGTVNDTSNVTANGDITEVEDYVQSRTGKIGVQSYSKMVQDYRQALLRVEKTIFEEMQQLFMLVY